VLTGVGLYRRGSSGAFIAPSDPDAQWDDEGYDSPEADRFGVVSQLPENGRLGFVFHSACWNDLCYMRPSKDHASLSRMFDICTSLPIPSLIQSVSWGHDFSGLVESSDIFYP
jgi:hypothetical protein